MDSDQVFRDSQLPVAQAEIVRQPDLGFNPEFRLAIRGRHVDVDAWLFPGKEEEPETKFAKQRRAHLSVKQDRTIHAEDWNGKRARRYRPCG